MWYPVELTIENVASHALSTYRFQGGRVVVIQGENHDKHSGQESNGSGKSGLLEGIAVALAGVSFRKVRAAELVRNGQESLRVVMSLRNERMQLATPSSNLTQQGVTMEIERVIYANTKASKVAVRLNGEPISRLTSVDEANEFILQQLGISKEDLLNYFLVSKEKFCSFFDSPDAKKKQLINRFSGADRLDQLIPQLEVKLADMEKRVALVRESETQSRTRVNVYKEELHEAQQAKPIQERENEVNALLERSNQLETDYSEAKDEATRAEEAKSQIAEELVALGSDTSAQKMTDLNAQSEGVANEVTKLQAAVKAVEGPGSEWAADRAGLNQKRDKLNEQLREAKSTLKEVEDFEAELQKTLRGSVECPKCEHPFSLAEPGSNIEECRAELKELNEVILPAAKSAVVQAQVAISRVDNEVEEARGRMEDRRREAEAAVTTYREAHEAPLQQRAAEIRRESQAHLTKFHESNNRLAIAGNKVIGLSHKIQRLKNELGEINDKIDRLQNAPLEDLVAPLLVKLDKAQQELTRDETDHEEAKQARDKAAAWPVRLKQFKSYLANQLLDTLSGYTNLYLEKIGSDLQIELEGYRLLADRKTIKEELTAKLLRGGEDAGSFHKYSGGEKGRVDMCQILAVQHLINLNAPTGGLNLLVTDEILESVDSRGIHEMARKLDTLERNIMIVTHAGADVPFPNRILIEKRNGVSSLAA